MSFEAASAANTGPMALNFNTTPDLVAWLPEGAADHLRKLRLHVSDLRAVVPPFSDRNDAATAKVTAEQRLTRLQAHPSQGGFGLKDSDGSVVDARRRVEELSAEAARLDQLYEDRSATSRSASTVLSNVETWLRDGRPSGTVLKDFDGPDPTLAKGEDVLSALDSVRRRVRELKADLHRIRSSPFPSSYAKQQMRAVVDGLAARGAVNVSRLVEHDGPVEFPTQQMQVAVHNAQPGAVGFVQVTDALALCAWLHRDALIAAVDREIATEADDAASLSHEAREQAEAVVMGDLLAVERDEAWFTWQALTAKLPVEHRSDIDPRALLAVVLVTAPAVSGRGSSPGHAFEIVEPGARRR